MKTKAKKKGSKKGKAKAKAKAKKVIKEAIAKVEVPKVEEPKKVEYAMTGAGKEVQIWPHFRVTKDELSHLKGWLAGKNQGDIVKALLLKESGYTGTITKA